MRIDARLSSSRAPSLNVAKLEHGPSIDDEGDKVLNQIASARADGKGIEITWA